MGDGYTLTEQDKFVSDARKLTDYLFTQSPWRECLRWSFCPDRAGRKAGCDQAIPCAVAQR